jgi:hypothetical protein
MAAPSWLREIPSHDDFRYALILALFRCSDLSLISVWSPSYLKLLIEAARKNGHKLVRDLQMGTITLDFDQSILTADHVSAPLVKTACIVDEWLKSDSNDFGVLSKILWPQLALCPAGVMDQVVVMRRIYPGISLMQGSRQKVFVRLRG